MDAYNKVESAYNEYIVPKVQKIKEHPILNTAVRTTLSLVPGSGPALLDWYDKTGDSDEVKTKQILQFLKDLQNTNEEQFQRIAEDLKSNLDAIIQNRIVITDLIAKSSAEILEELHAVKKDTSTILEKIDESKLRESQSYGLNYLPLDYFDHNHSNDEDLGNWKRGFPLELPAIKEKKEFRRGVVDDIENKLESQFNLLLTGESGMSKTTILKEIMCDYFDKDYHILYNYGDSEIKNGEQLVNFIEELLKEGYKVLVVVDNSHSERTAAIFYVIDMISTYDLRKNVRFILAAKLPDYKLFIDRLNRLPEIYRPPIRKIDRDSNFKYELPLFNKDEVKEFIKIYGDKKRLLSIYFGEEKSADLSDEMLEEISKKIYERTKGQPIMVKFSVFGQGLREDVQERYDNYLKEDPEKIKTMLVCSLFDQASLPLTDGLLDKMQILGAAYELDRATLYQNAGLWNTIHPRWNREFLSFMYDESNKKELYKNKEYLKSALNSIFDLRDEKTIISIIDVMYELTEFKVFSEDLVESVIMIPNYLSQKIISKIYLSMARGYTRLGNLSYLEPMENAIAKCGEALKIDSNMDEAWECKGNALRYFGRYEEAVECYNHAIRINPKNYDAWWGKASELYGLGKYDEAVECYDKVLENDPKYSWAWMARGECLNFLGKYEDAVKSFEKALEPDQDYDDALLGKGKALNNLKKYDDALKCFEKLIELKHDYDAKVWYNKGESLNFLGRYNEANKCFEKVLEIIDGYGDGADYSWNLELKGPALFYLKRYNEADKCFEKLIDQGYSPAWAWNLKGVILYNLKNYQESVTCFDKAIEADQKYAVAWYNRSSSKIKNGDIENSLADLKQAVEIGGNEYIKSAEEDEDFQEIRNDERFKVLISKYDN